MDESLPTAQEPPGRRLPPSDAKCQVCGHGLGQRPAVTCGACDTPHHLDCWNYQSRCSTFGCGCRGYVEIQVRPVPGPPVPDPLLPAPVPPPAPLPRLDMLLPLTPFQRALGCTFQVTYLWAAKLGAIFVGGMLLPILESYVGERSPVLAACVVIWCAISALVSLDMLMDPLRIHRGLRLLTRIDVPRNRIDHGYHYGRWPTTTGFGPFSTSMSLNSPRITIRRRWFGRFQIAVSVALGTHVPGDPNIPVIWAASSVPLGPVFLPGTPEAREQMSQASRLAQQLDWPVHLPGNELITAAYREAAAVLPPEGAQTSTMKKPALAEEETSPHS